MEGRYSQVKAMFSITKASLKATFRSPSAVIFSIGFPMILFLFLDLSVKAEVFQ
jgi:ABC-2 type transport system permease protein